MKLNRRQIRKLILEMAHESYRDPIRDMGFADYQDNTRDSKPDPSEKNAEIAKIKSVLASSASMDAINQVVELAKSLSINIQEIYSDLLAAVEKIVRNKSLLTDIPAANLLSEIDEIAYGLRDMAVKELGADVPTSDVIVADRIGDMEMDMVQTIQSLVVKEVERTIAKIIVESMR